MERKFSSMLALKERPSYPSTYRTGCRERQNWKGPTDFSTEETYNVTPFKSLPEIRWQQESQKYKEPPVIGRRCSKIRRPMSERTYLSRRIKQQHCVQKELQLNERSWTELTNYLYRDGSDMCNQRESLIRHPFHLPPLSRSEDAVEKNQCETGNIGFPIHPRPLSMLLYGPREYGRIGWNLREGQRSSGISSCMNEESREFRRHENWTSAKTKGHTRSQKQLIRLKKPSTAFCRKWEPEAKPIFGKTTEAAQKSSTYYLYFKTKHFPRFHYVYNLIRDCKSRVDKCRKGKVRIDEMFKNVIIKIGIVGKFTEDNVHLLTKSAEGKEMPKGKHTWKVQPLVCFEHDFFSKSNIKKSILESTCHKILIKADTFCDKRDKTDDSIIIVEKNKEQIKETITSCLEEPLHIMLQEWLEVLKTEGSSRLASGLIAEIEAIQKQMESCHIKDTDVSHVLRSAGESSIVPDDIIDFLFRRPEVNSFGIWWNYSFKVFVNETDEKRLRDDLTKMNPTFFAKYNIEIESGRLKDKLLHLMQGDEIQAEIPNKQKFNAGTLGGIVTKADDENKKYALTCHHLFPKVGERAYNKNFDDIGACFYTTKEKSCDFAAIEIKKPFSENCNETFQKEDGEITNAQVFSENLKNVGIVHKIGATTKVTKGRILSSEYYDKSLDHNNREHVFLVKGIQGNFSEEGDSGSLVFTRSKNAQQTCVDVLGMVYSNKEDDNDEQKSKNEEDNESSNTSPSSEGDDAASNVKEADNISSCYRIHTALELFKQNKGEEVKFKDDLLLSSLESSSEFDDSNEETPQ